MNPTERCTFARYINEQLQRAAYFAKRDGARSLEIHSALATYVKKHGPSGSGLDVGTKLDGGRSKPEKLVFCTEFHHMNDAGFYDGWTQHVVTATPGFATIHLHVSGRDRNNIKDLLHETFGNWLRTEADHPALIEQEWVFLGRV